MKDIVKQNEPYDDFGKKILSIAPQVYPYIKHRLYTAEVSEIIPRNMYKTAEIVDDVILQLYEDFDGELKEDGQLRLKLFTLVNENLDKLFKKEEFHKDTLSTSQILNSELEKLEEKFEMDLDQDLLMSDELDDISYHQDDAKRPVFLYDDIEKNIIQSLEIDDPRKDLNEEKRASLNRIYNWLPIETSNILDLFVLGKLSYEEIALVKGTEPAKIKKIIRAINKNFRKNLN